LPLRGGLSQLVNGLASAFVVLGGPDPVLLDFYG
jgi:hypothetical protein